MKISKWIGEVNIYQNLYIKVCGVNWLSPEKGSQKGMYLKKELFYSKLFSLVNIVQSVHFWAQNNSYNIWHMFSKKMWLFGDFSKPEATEYLLNKKLTIWAKFHSFWDQGHLFSGNMWYYGYISCLEAAKFWKN